MAKVDPKFNPANALLPDELLISQGKKLSLITIRKGSQKTTFEENLVIVEECKKYFSKISIRVKVISGGHYELLELDKEGMNKNLVGLITFKYFIRV